MKMRNRRFTILAVALVALNLVLWLAPQGLALRRSLINQLFGPRMIRAEVVVQTGGGGGQNQDYRLDRGVVTAVTAGGITLREADGTMQPIPISAGTRVLGAGRLGLAGLARRGVQVLVVRVANGPAISIQAEGGLGRRGELP